MRVFYFLISLCLSLSASCGLSEAELATLAKEHPVLFGGHDAVDKALIEAWRQEAKEQEALPTFHQKSITPLLPEEFPPSWECQ